MTPMEIELTIEEMAEYGAIGISRYADICKRGEIKKSTRGESADRKLQRYIRGAWYEGAVAKAYGIAHSFRGIEHPDVGMYEVRGTEYENGKLILRPVDEKKKHLPFILVTGDNGVYKIRGWTIGSWWLQPSHLVQPDENQEPCWMIEQGYLFDPFLVPPEFSPKVLQGLQPSGCSKSSAV